MKGYDILPSYMNDLIQMGVKSFHTPFQRARSTPASPFSDAKPTNAILPADSYFSTLLVVYFPACTVALGLR
jgi:hypothetical protein